MDGFHQVIKILVFALLWCMCFGFSRLFSLYNPNMPNAQYITVKNDFLARLFIAKPNRKNRNDISESDKKKLSLFSLITYIIQAVLAVAFVVLQLVPSIPCEPFEFHYGRRGSITLYTINDKIPLILAMLLSINELVWTTLPSIINNVKMKKQKLGFWNVVALIIAMASFIALSIYLLVHLFI